MSNDGQSSDSDDSDDDGCSASDQPPPAVVDPQAEMCEVCLIQPRGAQHALVPFEIRPIFCLRNRKSVDG